MDAMKAKEKEMIAEKEAIRQVINVAKATSHRLLICIQESIAKAKEKREKKAERERFEKLAETMHKKRIERLKRKEKRNKMIKS